MKPLLTILWAFLLLAPAHAQVRLRISIKQVRDPNGNLPTTGIFTNSQTDAEAAIKEANSYLDLAGFGYRLELTDYTAVNDAAIPVANNLTSQAWNLPPASDNVGYLEAFASSPGNNYAWRADAVNVYITQGGGTFIGYCSYPNESRSTIILSSNGGRSRGQLLLHETGHFYILGHTFACCSCCDRGANPSCSHSFGASGPGSSGWATDLLQDLACDFPDDIATNRFGVGRTVATLTPDEFRLFSITYSNLMSYHSLTFMLSDIQKDAVAIVANTSRANTATGKTRFVSNSGFVFGKEGAASSPSLASVAQGIAAANSGDVVKVHSGYYSEPQLINQPINKRMMLIASRGSVTIGR